jgi:hypothetical protein
MESVRIRIRNPPTRFVQQPLPDAHERVLSPEAAAQKEVNQVLKDQRAANQRIIEDNADRFACPLMRKAPRKVSVRPNGVRYDTPQECPFLGVQPKKLAVAGDGHYYDCAHIKRYIRENMHHELRSPVTNEPMTAVVYTTEKDPKTKKLKTVAWTPELYESDEDPDEVASANATGEQAPMVVD